MRNTGSGVGEIVEVQGGHIVRSTGRKDRHSKVCTAKGPRDRRVRLSAHTAIQFYDVQDRLGYDRPSKAVDWLINKAKAAIDQLAELPAWNPTPTSAPPPPQQQPPPPPPPLMDDKYRYNSAAAGYAFLPPPLDTDIADTIKSFFPETSTTSFHTYPPPPDQQDLRLSLQSFQDPILLHHHHQPQPHLLFAGTTALGFDAASSGWSEEHDHARLHRMVPWNNTNSAAADAANTAHAGGFVFNAPSPPPPTVFGHGQYFSSQRGPLQSSNTPSIRAWMDPSSIAAAPTAAAADHHHHHHHHHLSPAMIHQGSVSAAGIGFAASSGGFSGFRIPARIQGEEEHDGVSDKPSSASSDSRH